jgi:hypothetical protein
MLRGFWLLLLFLFVEEGWVEKGTEGLGESFEADAKTSHSNKAPRLIRGQGLVVLCVVGR